MGTSCSLLAPACMSSLSVNSAKAAPARLQYLEELADSISRSESVLREFLRRESSASFRRGNRHSGSEQGRSREAAKQSAASAFNPNCNSKCPRTARNKISY